MSSQYLRKVGLLVQSASKGLDLSQLGMHFKIFAADVDRPPTAVIRVYNLSDATAKSIQTEFQVVRLQAGYEGGNFAQIFNGTIAQVRRGREDALDSYVDIYAGSGDIAFNSSVINKTLAAGSSIATRAQAVIGQMKADDQSVSQGSIPNSLGTGGILPRGKVLFGLGRDHMTDLAGSADTSWSIDQNGVINMVPVSGYLPGDIVKINSATGMIGVPEATPDGIIVTCLLNPLIKLGTRIQLNNADINTTTVNQQGFPSYSDLTFFANTSADGIYRALVIEQEGALPYDNPWYTQITCLALDSSASPGSSVVGNN